MYNMEKRLQRKICIIIIGWLSIGLGAYLKDIPVTLHQPDGTTLECLSSGDEFYVRLHDENNYTIIQNPEDGYYYYAQFVRDEVVPSQYRAGSPLPEAAEIKQEKN